MTTTQPVNYNQTNEVLYMGLELSKYKWVLGGSIGLNKINIKSIDSFDMADFLKCIRQFKERFNLCQDCPVKIVFESGLDGFSVYRTLASYGFEVMQVDSSSIELNRRKRKAKTDKIDVKKLTNLLYRFHHGEQECLRAVRVPSVAEEDLRRLHREYEQLQKEQGQHENRIMSILAVNGIPISIQAIKRKDFEQRLKSQSFKTPLGDEIPANAQMAMEREYERYKLVHQQLLCLKREATNYVRNHSESKVAQQVTSLQRLKGLGFWGAWKLATEWFSWRTFNNRKEVGSAAGLTGVPHQSGEMDRDQGISKAGNKRIRRLGVELSWMWLRYQPESQLSQWFHQRFVQGKRTRRIGIVALARKLLIMFWRYLSKGVLPEDVALKAV